MKRHGVRVKQPKNKQETWGIKVADAEFWNSFEAIIAGWTFAQFVTRLQEEKANGKRDAQNLFEIYAPEIPRLLKAQPDDKWNNPINTPEFRDSLGPKFWKALVKDDASALAGKLPVRPENFEIDPQLQREAQVAVAKWKEDRKKRGLKDDDTGTKASTSAPSLIPVCPELEASVLWSGDVRVRGTLITCSDLLATIAVNGAQADSVVLGDSFRTVWKDSDEREVGVLWKDSDEVELSDFIPGWALEHVSMKLARGAGVARILVRGDDDLVVLDERESIKPVPETDDSPAEAAHVELFYSAIVKPRHVRIEPPACRSVPLSTSRLGRLCAGPKWLCSGNR